MNRLTRLVAAVLVVVAASLLAAPPASAARPHPHRRPWPITVTVRTVPALPGVRLNFDGYTITTDAAGEASYTAEHDFSQHSLELEDTTISTVDRRYRFVRWSGQRDPNQAFWARIDGLPLRANYTVTAGFAVQYPVTARFVDDRGRPVDPAMISAVKIKSDTGAVIDLDKSGTTWLDGVMPTYHKSELVTGGVSYSLQSVVIRGTNTVDAGKQKFDPGATTTPSFTLQFHDLTIQAHDAFYHSALGTLARVTYPDGTVHTVAFGPDHRATLRGLPRGPYTVKVTGANGMALTEQFTLSRDKALDLTVVSIADLAVVAVAGLVLAAGLLLVGRARPRRFLLSALRRVARRLVPPRTQKAQVG